MLVGDDGKVAARPIKTGAAQGNKWIITDGLKNGEKVIVEGIQKVKPGAPAKPVPWQGATGQTAASAPAAGSPAAATPAAGSPAAGTPAASQPPKKS
jgi:membrane fusion protein (multidrug efflux system)